MRWIGFDPGQARCGVAISDPLGILASPVTVLMVEPRDSLGQRLADALGRAGAMAHGEVIAGLVCGLALDARGKEGPAALAGRELGTLVHQVLQSILATGRPGGQFQPESETMETTLELHFVDERFSTADMRQRRSQAGVKGRQQKSEIDAWAAAAILQDFLDRRKAASSNVQD